MNKLKEMIKIAEKTVDKIDIEKELDTDAIRELDRVCENTNIDLVLEERKKKGYEY